MTKQEFTLPIYDTQGRQIDEMRLDPTIFDGEVNTAAIYQAVLMYRANQRRGLASTKTRGEVSGGGKKPWRQKGTGRARVGSIRSPLWRHGGVIFGPHPRDFSSTIPDKIKLLALKSTLNAKLKENNLILLDNLKIDTPKTKQMQKILNNLKAGKKVLLLLEAMSNDILRAGRNINMLTIDLARNANAYEILSFPKVIVTCQALLDLMKRIKK